MSKPFFNSRLHPASSLGLAVMALTAVTGCATVVLETGKYAVQHTAGAKLGPCPAGKDSVTDRRGRPWRRASSDEEGPAPGEQRFWHEWGYRHPLPGELLGSDSVIVVGFLWGSGVDGCDVRERRARAPGPHGLAWENFGEVPGPR
jgi:hypothetical protein